MPSSVVHSIPCPHPGNNIHIHPIFLEFLGFILVSLPFMSSSSRIHITKTPFKTHNHPHHLIDTIHIPVFIYIPNSVWVPCVLIFKRFRIYFFPPLFFLLPSLFQYFIMINATRKPLLFLIFIQSRTQIIIICRGR